MTFVKSVMVAAAGLAMAGTAAMAQDNSLYFAPQVSSSFTSPSIFDGVYAGIMMGPISARHKNYFTNGADLRYQFGGVLGYNSFVAPGVVVGGEIQATLNTDFLVANDFDAMLLGRVGFLTANNFMSYALAGVGYFVNAPSYEVGLGVEYAASDTLSLRLEGVGIGQLGNVPNGNNIPGISALRVTTGAVWHFGPHSGMGVPDGVNATPTDFTGTYAGLYVGGFTNPKYNFFPDHGYGLHLSRFALGGAAGYNFAVAPGFRIGAEAQGGIDFDSSGDVSPDALALARVGFIPLDGLMVYGAGGLGLVDGKAAYAVGGGAEYAVWGQNTLRGEVLGLGELNSAPVVSGISAVKFSVGTLWHFN